MIVGVTGYHEGTKIHEDTKFLLYKLIFVCSCLFLPS